MTVQATNSVLCYIWHAKYFLLLKMVICLLNLVKQFRAVCKLEGHSGSVTAIDALYVDRNIATNRRLLVVTASADSTLKIWRRHSNQGLYYK